MRRGHTDYRVILHLGAGHERIITPDRCRKSGLVLRYRRDSVITIERKRGLHGPALVSALLQLILFIIHTYFYKLYPLLTSSSPFHTHCLVSRAAT